MEQTLRILLLEDSPDDAALIERMLKKEGILFTSRTVETKQEFEKGLVEFLPDVVISDHTLPQFNSQEALKTFQNYKNKNNPTAVFILVTGTVSEEFAVKIIKEGADDYILKDRLTRLPSAVIGALEKNRLAEEKRSAEDEKLQLLDILQKSLNEIFIFCSDTLKFKYVNEEALRNLGFTIEEMNQMTPMDLIEDANVEDFKRILSKITETKKGKILESYGIRKDKSRFPVQVHLQLIEQHGGTKTFLANVLDITEIKVQEQQKELALFIQDTFNQNSDLRTSLEIVLEGICRRKNLTAGEVFASNFENTKLKRFATFDSEDKDIGNIGEFLSEIVLKKAEPVFFQNLQEENLPEVLQKENRFKSAKAFSIGFGKEVLAVIILYSDKEFRKKESFTHLGEGLRNQIANNLKRKRTEDELTKIFEYSPEVLSIVSTDGYFKRVNPFFSELLGYSTEEILSTPYLDFLHPDDLETLEDWKKNVNVQHVTHYQNRFKTKKGQYRWIAWSVTPFYDENLSFAVGMDITDEKRNLEAIELQNKRLAEIAWEQSHVVRAPLARMLGCIHHLEDSKDHSEELMKNIKSSALELDEIIKTIVEKSELIKNI